MLDQGLTVRGDGYGMLVQGNASDCIEQMMCNVFLLVDVVQKADACKFWGLCIMSAGRVAQVEEKKLAYVRSQLRKAVNPRSAASSRLFHS